MARTYFLIAGEASGDLHASHLVRALRKLHPDASFHGVGGDLMAAEGVRLVYHYSQLAYMGWWPVLRHLPTILRGMKRCRQEILRVQPTAVVLVDYPGFNLQIAKYVKKHTSIPVCYYISPKIWAWKEHRIKAIRRDVDSMLCILPFEKDYYRDKHHYEVTYVGNPSLDEVEAFLRECPSAPIDSKPCIALLPGSRKQEIRANLPRMMEAAASWADEYELVVAGAPGIAEDFYTQWLPKRMDGDGCHVRVVYGQTFSLLRNSTAALVTSGTATLETALMGVPQVVCYRMRMGWAVRILRKWLLSIRYISLVNLITGRESVPELVGADMNVKMVSQHLQSILPGGDAREAQLADYQLLRQRLGETGASEHAAEAIQKMIKKQQ